MRKVTTRTALYTATALTGVLFATPAMADCISQAPVNPNQVVCDNPGTAGWNGAATNAIVVTVNSGSTVTTNVGGPAIISTGTGSAVINFSGLYNGGAATYGIDAGAVTSGAISVGAGSIVTNDSGAALRGTVTFGNATGAVTNVLNNNYSSSGATNNIGLIDGRVIAVGNLTVNNKGVIGLTGGGGITQTGAGTVTISNGIDGGYVSAYTIGGVSLKNGVIYGTGNAINTQGSTTLVNHGGGTAAGSVISSGITLGSLGTGTSSLTNGSQAFGNATIVGNVIMADKNNTVNNDGTITGNVTMNGTGTNTYNAGSSGSAGDNGLRLPGSAVDGTGTPTGIVTGTLTGLAANSANNTLNLNGTGLSTLQAGSNVLNFGVVNKNDSGTWTIKNTLDGAAGKLTTVNLNAGVLSVDGASFLGSSATTVHNNVATGNLDGLVFNGTTAGTFAGNIDGTGQTEIRGPNATTLTGTNTYTGNTYINGGTLNANSTGALSAQSAMYMGNGTLNINANSTSIYLSDYFGPSNVINIASGTSYSVGSGHFGDNGGVINGPGTLIKYSTGVLDLSGADQIAPGALIVNNGTVNDIGGALAATTAVTVNSTATTTGVLNVTASDTIGSLAGTGANAQVNLSAGVILDAGGLNTNTVFAGKIAGAGALAKSGTGTMTLTGSNTYSGNTYVFNGTLIGYAGSTATNGSLQRDIYTTGSASLVFDQSLSPNGNGSGTFTGIMSGGSSATFIGNASRTAVLTLTNNNTGLLGVMNFSTNSVVAISNANNVTLNTLNFAGGTLENTANITLANAVVLNAGGGTFQTDPATTLTLTGGVSGAGQLVKTGTGTLILGAPSSYTGGTLVSAGILQGRAGSAIQGNIVNNATVMLWGNLDIYNGNMSGTGNVVIFNNAPNPNTIMGFITGTNTYSGSTTVNVGAELEGFTANSLSPNSAFIVNGILTQGSSVHTNTIGSLAGSGLVVANGTLIIGNDNTSTTFSGKFGAGGFFAANSVNVTKIGTGTQTLTGVGSVLTGALTVNGGTLALGSTGTLTAATTTVNTGAILSVDGTLTSPTVTVAVGGRLVGGIGTTSGKIIGAVTNSGTIAPGHSPGILAITGSYVQTGTGTYAADVNGNGTSTVVAGVDFDRIAVSGAPGTAALAGTLAITQNGGSYVTGTTYDIIITTGGISGAFTTVTGTSISAFQSLSNALANGGGIQGNNYRLVVIRAAYNTVALNPNQVAVANGLTGIIGSAGSAATINKIDGMNAAQAQALFQGLNPEPYAAYATALQDQGELFTRQVGQRLSETGNPDKATGLWMNVYGQWANGKSSDYRFGSDHKITGGAIGLDMGGENLRFGVAGGYSEDKLTYLGGNSSGTSKSWQVGGYMGYNSGALHLDAQVAYISGDITASKAVNAGAGATLIQGTAVASTKGNLIKGVATLGYNMGGASVTFMPFIGVDFTSGHINGFTESGMGTLNLTVADIDAKRTDLVVGARLAAPMGAISPYLNVTYRYNLDDNARTATAYFNGVSSAPFTVSAIGSGRSVVDVDAGISGKIGTGASLFVGYQGSFRNDLDSHGVNGGLRVSF